MKRIALLALLPIPLLAATAALAGGAVPGNALPQQQPTSQDDPYIPPPGSPDIAGDDGLGDGSSDLNPDED